MTLLAFAAACGGDSDPVSPTAASPLAGPSFHTSEDATSTSVTEHYDLRPVSASSSAASEPSTTGSVTVTWQLPTVAAHRSTYTTPKRTSGNNKFWEVVTTTMVRTGYDLAFTCTGSTCAAPASHHAAAGVSSYPIPGTLGNGVYTVTVRGTGTETQKVEKYKEDKDGNVTLQGTDVTPSEHASGPVTTTFEVKIPTAPAPVVTGPKDQTITFSLPTDPAFSLVYGVGHYAIPSGAKAWATASSGLTVTYAGSPSTVCAVNANNEILVKGVGTCTITASQAGNDDWKAAMSVSKPFEITKAPLTVTAYDVVKTYDVQPFAPTEADVDVSGLGINFEGKLETTAVLGGALAFEGNAVGAVDHAATPYVLTPKGWSSDNYAITFVSGSLTINKATPTVTATGGTFTYAPNTAQPGSGVATGVGGVALTTPALTFSYLEGTTPLTSAPTDAGTYTATAHYAGSLNYTAASSAPATITINQALATLDFDDASLTQKYTGSPLAPTVTTSPAGLKTVTLAYSVDGTTVAPPTNTGVYKVVATLANRNYYALPIDAFFAIYDPNGGFVTGGGWINSEKGSCRNWSACTIETIGKANFGFVSKYVAGKSSPTGNTEFQFHAGNLKFKSTSYETLVVSGDRAQYWGEGTVNGVAGYSFRLTAVDGGAVDKFRMEIWQGTRDTGVKVYDNQWGTSETAPAPDAALTTAIAGGSIQIKK